jgi:3-deoxy-D-arabino-heptulosonate 7-phosphate (DAHP) synthase class II
MSREEALEIIEEIKENVNVCCAITMEPDEVLVLIDKLESYIENGE